MTPRAQREQQQQVNDDVQAMLARATRSQLQRLLRDIAAHPVKEHVTYDA